MSNYFVSTWTYRDFLRSMGDMGTPASELLMRRAGPHAQRVGIAALGELQGALQRCEEEGISACDAGLVAPARMCELFELAMRFSFAFSAAELPSHPCGEPHIEALLRDSICHLPHPSSRASADFSPQELRSFPELMQSHLVIPDSEPWKPVSAGEINYAQCNCTYHGAPAVVVALEPTTLGAAAAIQILRLRGFPGAPQLLGANLRGTGTLLVLERETGSTSDLVDVKHLAPIALSLYMLSAMQHENPELTHTLDVNTCLTTTTTGRMVWSLKALLSNVVASERRVMSEQRRSEATQSRRERPSDSASLRLDTDGSLELLHRIAHPRREGLLRSERELEELFASSELESTGRLARNTRPRGEAAASELVGSEMLHRFGFADRRVTGGTMQQMMESLAHGMYQESLREAHDAVRINDKLRAQMAALVGRAANVEHKRMLDMALRDASAAVTRMRAGDDMCAKYNWVTGPLTAMLFPRACMEFLRFCESNRLGESFAHFWLATGGNPDLGDGVELDDVAISFGLTACTSLSDRKETMRTALSMLPRPPRLLDIDLQESVRRSNLRSSSSSSSRRYY